jgi:hypothetical protein
MERPLGMPETVPGQARIEIENDLNNIEAALDLNNILQLDNDLFATIDRLHLDTPPAVRPHRVKHMAVWPESIGVQQLRSYLGNTCHRRGKLNRISVMARPALYLFEEDRKGYSARPAKTKSSHLATALNRREFDAIWNTPTVRAFASGKSGSAIAGISMRLIGCGNWLGIKQMILDRALDRHRGHFRDPQSNGIVASSLL